MENTSSISQAILRWAIYGSIIGSIVTIGFSSLVTQASSPDGIFGDYFIRIVGGNAGNGTCPSWQAIVGFSTGAANYGMPICGATASTMTGANGFGDVLTRSSDTVYQAMTDGFVLAIPGNDSTNYWSYLQWETADTPAGPWTLLLTGRGYSPAGGQWSITLPVKKGKYWRISTAYGVGASSVL